MELTNTFTIPVSVDEAWDVLLDVERIAPCMPGAKLLSAADDEFEGSMRVKLGPMTVTYKGTAKIIERDDGAHRAVIEASGKEARGSGTARATVTTRLESRGDETEVHIVTDFAVTGKPAQFGRGVMADVAERLVDRFAARLAEEITQPAAEKAPVEGAPAGEAATAGQSAPVGESAPRSGTEPVAPTVVEAPREEEALDLWEVAGGPVIKRAAPLLAGAGVLLLLIWLLRRRR